MNVADIETLYAYNRWANGRMFSALEKLSDEQFAAPMQSSFPSIQETVVHIFSAEWIWLKRWKGISPRAAEAYSTSTLRDVMTSHGVPSEAIADLAGLRSFADSLDRERQEFIGALNDESLHTRLTFRDMAGKEFSEPLVELMQHVVNHGSYHRGQVTTLLRQARAETVSLDMLFFFREKQQGAAG
jgi:uncharacterized damage-inducible protein DinB